MKYSKTKNMLNEAFKNKYAVAAINISNMETIAAVLAAADSLDAPVIVQVSPLQKNIQAFEYSEIVNMIHMIAKRFNKGEYSIHLDHSCSYEDCLEAVKGGFESIMFDGAALPYEKNIELTALARRISPDITLEGELGELGGAEGELSGTGENNYTNPKQASDFIRCSGVDSLAVSIGNAHGIYKGEVRINLDILSEINKVAGIPLVLHGASGIPAETIRESINRGISKINFFTELDMVFKAGLREKLDENKYMMEACRNAQDRMTLAAIEIIDLCVGGKSA